MNIIKSLSYITLISSILMPLQNVRSDVSLSGIFSDNMVIQCNKPFNIWGTALPGEKVTVKVDGRKKSVTTSKDGKWRLDFPPLKASFTPLTIKIKANNSITLDNVLVGEVWICAGQSNMKMKVKEAKNAAKEIASANYPGIRLFQVPSCNKAKPQNSCGGKWVLCSPETVDSFSAAGYFFGLELRKKLNVPIGLIEAAWGGTPIEAWIPMDVFEKDPAYAPIVNWWKNAIKSYDLKAAKKELAAEMKEYELQLANKKRRKELLKQFHENPHEDKAQRKKLAAEIKHLTQITPHVIVKPRLYVNPIYYSSRPAVLFNGMINPLIPYGIRGVIWYQGEANAKRAWFYRKEFQDMISAWRRYWEGEDFPFIFVQLANCYPAPKQPGPSHWAELREAQTMALCLPNTAQAVAIDIGEGRNIHPQNKQDVGKRLALAARKIAYNENIIYSGPMYNSMCSDGNKLIISFKHAENGLICKGKNLIGFEIAGKDKQFHWADARIDGDKVIVSSQQVQKPIAARYGWANNPQCNLYNSAGLPASPFRTDNWKILSEGNVAKLNRKNGK